MISALIKAKYSATLGSPWGLDRLGFSEVMTSKLRSERYEGDSHMKVYGSWSQMVCGPPGDPETLSENQRSHYYFHNNTKTLLFFLRGLTSASMCKFNSGWNCWCRSRTQAVDATVSVLQRQAGSKTRLVSLRNALDQAVRIVICIKLTLNFNTWVTSF